MLDIVNKQPSVKAFDPSDPGGDVAEQPASVLSQVLQGLAALLQAAVPVEVTIRIGAPAASAAPAVPVVPKLEQRAIAAADVLDEEVHHSTGRSPRLPGGPRSQPLTPLAAKMLGILDKAERPLTARAIALRLGRRKAGAQMKSLLKKLQDCDPPLIRKVGGEGYWRCNRPLPPAKPQKYDLSDTDKRGHILHVLAQSPVPLSAAVLEAQVTGGESIYLRGLLERMIGEGTLVFFEDQGYWPTDKPIATKATWRDTPDLDDDEEDPEAIQQRLEEVRREKEGSAAE